MSKRPSPHGVVLIDKPVGITSFDVLRRLRGILGTKKLGHAGTLDPFASGLLVVCVGEYTRFAGYLTDDAKIYEADVALGVETNTDDLEGEAIARFALAEDWHEGLPEVLEQFRGVISQIPPQFSAIHVDGQRAYALARRGEDVEIPARDVEIHALDLKECQEDGFRFRVHASKGTYIRAMARDMGRALGVGGHLRGLRRVSSGPFHVDASQDLEQLSQAPETVRYLQGREALQGLASLVLDSDEVRKMRFGQLADRPETAHGLYALYTEDDALLGLGDVLDVEEDAEGQAIEPRRVLKVRRLMPEEKA